MFRVLLVEDEMLVRLGLKNSIDWGKFGMAVIADAADGQTAEQIYRKEKPDLVITDLKMPVMDGMELITRIRARDKETRIIILSCLSEFELARKAMTLGVSDYILKLTMSEEEIEAVLKRAQQELTERCGVRTGQQAASKYDTKEKTIKEFLYYANLAEHDFAAYVRDAGLRLSPARLAVCVMRIDHFDALKARLNDRQGEHIKTAILSILEDITARYGRGEAIHDDGALYTLLFSFSDIPGENEANRVLAGILGNIMSVIDTHINASVCFGISDFEDGYGSLGRMYAGANAALEQRFFSGASMFFANQAGDAWGPVVAKLASCRRHPKLMYLLGETALTEYDGRFGAFIASEPRDQSRVLAFLGHIVQWLASMARLQESDSVNLAIEAYEQLKKCETLDEALEAFRGFLDLAVGETLKRRTMSREIAETLQYVKSNFTRDISLTQAAGHVGLSPNYLGNLFKKEIKVTFTEYLNDTRIEKAKQLLLGTNLKSYEIAGQVGFSDHSYFSKVFKKATSHSPNDFRNRLGKEWTEEMEHDQGRA